MALLTMAQGLLIGTTIGSGPVQGLMEKGSLENQNVHGTKIDAHT